MDGRYRWTTARLYLAIMTCRGGTEKSRPAETLHSFLSLHAPHHDTAILHKTTHHDTAVLHTTTHQGRCDQHEEQKLPAGKPETSSLPVLTLTLTLTTTPFLFRQFRCRRHRRIRERRGIVIGPMPPRLRERGVFQRQTGAQQPDAQARGQPPIGVARPPRGQGPHRYGCRHHGKGAEQHGRPR